MRPDSHTSATFVAPSSARGLTYATFAAPVTCQNSESPTTKLRIRSPAGSTIKVVGRTRALRRGISRVLLPPRLRRLGRRAPPDRPGSAHASSTTISLSRAASAGSSISSLIRSSRYDSAASHRSACSARARSPASPGTPDRPSRQADCRSSGPTRRRRSSGSERATSPTGANPPARRGPCASGRTRTGPRPVSGSRSCPPRRVRIRRAEAAGAPSQSGTGRCAWWAAARTAEV